MSDIPEEEKKIVITKKKIGATGENENDYEIEEVKK